MLDLLDLRWNLTSSDFVPEEEGSNLQASQKYFDILEFSFWYNTSLDVQ